MTSNAAFTSGTTTKVTLDTEIFDTNNNFASSRFTPTVAGYYLINGKVRITGTGCTGNATLYKNGAQLIIGSYVAATSSVIFSTVSTVVYLNGSTDYIELYGYGDTTSGSPTFQYIAVGNTCEMSGCLLRGA
jgi:aspartate 1-decarboxylase